MEYRQLGGSGLKVSALSFGTATFGGGDAFFSAWGNTDVAQASRLVDISLEAGVNLFDTADVYSGGRSEEVLGKAIAGRRDQLLLSTKATFRMGDGPNELGSSRYHLIRACEDSLRRLKTDHIDIYTMHGFDALTPVEETLRTLDTLVQSGKVRYIACSNFSGWHLMKSLATAQTYGWMRYVPTKLFTPWSGASTNGNSCRSPSTRRSARSSGVLWPRGCSRERSAATSQSPRAVECSR